jgi:hypothetical protein
LLFQILVNRAHSAGTREHRNAPIGDPEAAVDRSRFDLTGHWRSPLHQDGSAYPLRPSMSYPPTNERL